MVIAGGGLAGLTLAVALKQAAGDALGVTVVDPTLGQPTVREDDRAYAIAAAGRRLFCALGVWERMAEGAQAIEDMVITDSRPRDAVRPIYLSFTREAEGEPFAHMVFNRTLNRVMEQACREAGVALVADRVTGAAVETGGPVTVSLADGEPLRGALVVAADGKRSALRAQAGIGWVGWGYGQSGIVATVHHERDHHGRAHEHFMPAGPFAILPLPPTPEGQHRSSLVWTERTADAQALLSLSREDLMEELELRFGHALGAIALASPVRAYPLMLGMARRFVAERLALVGDAAHVVHPIAGQGLNLGLRDVAALAEGIVETARLGLDIGSPAVLASYERARRFDTVAMAVATDGLNRLFSNDLQPVRLMRDLGLGLVERAPFLKRFFIAEAAGRTDSGPKLLRGLAL